MSDKPKKEKKEKPPKEKKEKKEKKAKKQKLPKPSNKKVKVCPNCLAEIPKKAKACPHCAAKQKGKNPLLFVLPLLLVLVIGAGVSIYVFHFPIAPPAELPFEIPFLSGPKISETVLGQGMELTAKQEEAVNAVFSECGFKQITQVSKIGADSTTTSYAVEDADTERFMSTDDPIEVRVENETKTVQSITFQSNPIYADGEVVSQMTDYYMDMSERDVYMQAALDEVKARLDLPEVAVFPSRSHWTFQEEEGDVLIVSSTVTTKGGSGAETVRPFQVRFQEGSFVSVTFTEQNGQDGAS